MSILPIGFISHPVDFKISCTYTSPFNSTLIEIYGDIIRVSQGIDGCQMLEYIARLSKKSNNADFCNFACNEISVLQASKSQI